MKRDVGSVGRLQVVERPNVCGLVTEWAGGREDERPNGAATGRIWPGYRMDMAHRPSGAATY